MHQIAAAGQGADMRQHGVNPCAAARNRAIDPLARQQQRAIDALRLAQVLQRPLQRGGVIKPGKVV